MQMIRFATLAIASLVTVLAANADTSLLWGKNGELWTGPANSRLPDYSYAGYRHGEAPLPFLPVVANVVTDYGAVGDGVTNDTQAFLSAIANENNGAIYVPPGTYLIRSILNINKNNLVLRGAGEKDTILLCDRTVPQMAGSSGFTNGGFVWIGYKNTNGAPKSYGSKITNVVQQAARGDMTLKLAGTGGILPGDFVILDLTEANNGSLHRHLHNDLASGGNCSWQPFDHRWPVEVTSVQGSWITLKQPLRHDVDLSWKPEIRRFDPGAVNSGIENLTIRFANGGYNGHFNEKGYNALCFQGALDCWARDVTVEKVDVGVTLALLTKRCTIQNVTVIGASPNGSGQTAHFGFAFSNWTSDNLLTGFDIPTSMHHCVSVQHGANGNVARDGRGANINIDHHRNSPFENLFSDIHVGAGSKTFSSAGSSCAGPYAGARETFWNVRNGNSNHMSPPSWLTIQANVISATSNQMTSENAWYEHVENIQPQDLYASQLTARFGTPNPNPYGLGKVSSLGGIAVLTPAGIPALSSQNFSIGLSQAIPLSSGVLIFGQKNASTPWFGGTLLIGAPLKRMQAKYTNSQGSQLWTIPIDSGMIGTTRYYQSFFRDLQHHGGTGVGMSNALAVTFRP